MVNIKIKEKRIQILTSDEIKDLYSTPIFNASEREEYFALDKTMLKKIRVMCSGLIEPDTLMRDNKRQSERCHHESKTNT